MVKKTHKPSMGAEEANDNLNGRRESFFFPINGRPSLICHPHGTFEPVKEKGNQWRFILSLVFVGTAE